MKGKNIKMNDSLSPTYEELYFRGVHKTSLVDFPGEVCTTLFCGGCNFRCPWCHNADLVLRPQVLPIFPAKEVIKLLERRRHLVEAVCVTGGEPTLSKGLEDFLVQLKNKGFKVKLDTNGTQPGVLARLLEKNLLDYVAMDIKAPPEKYDLLAGTKVEMTALLESIKILKNSPIAYEFRTTVVPTLITLEDLKAIGKWLLGARCFVLQPFKASSSLIDMTLAQLPPCPEELLTKAASYLRYYFMKVEVRN
ncbi:pyruvate formate lyase activating enzyme [Thermanaeromonas toyohensis ToBE]|uniref:Pyruvate formate lyase activating enzyme n=1 Tax=Thermanaeromonas toyohensis ToBE TaxID=698762 RepID=A0A1W1VE76_9FIRM|nr:anaerobic ribonucleoside-triphosphate reductase activating protein [Thermanaeromonas toyohensis]SMB91244.1 pyruvate formate lyase activating enzyme [Thermanaeromonas toyohensis ToBE]